MSRTRKGSKGPGHEFWSPRPPNQHGASPDRRTKTQTHRTERRVAKHQLRQGRDLPARQAF